jgi:hypothetical protein
LSLFKYVRLLLKGKSFSLIELAPDTGRSIQIGHFGKRHPKSLRDRR